MKLQIGVNQKMKLYNVYRICKQNIDFFEENNLTQYSVNGQTAYKMDNWKDFQEKLKLIRRIVILKEYVDNYFNTIPIFIRERDILNFPPETASKLTSIKEQICNRMNSVIDLYESMNLGDSGNGLDIKLPQCENFKDYISYLKDIDFIFTNCPFLQNENEILKFDSVDVGSNWLKFTVVTTASTCIILGSIASLVDKAMSLKSHYITIQQQQEELNSMQIKNELAEKEVEIFDLLKKKRLNDAISALEDEFGEIKDPEERTKAEKSLEKLEALLEEGAEFYATLDSPKEIQALFPQIEDDVSLPDNVVNYIEQKEQTGQ